MEFMYLVFTRLCTLYLHVYVPCIYTFMYLVFTRMPDETERRPPRSLLYLCYVFGALINSLCVDSVSHLLRVI